MEIYKGQALTRFPFSAKAADIGGIKKGDKFVVLDTGNPDYATIFEIIKATSDSVSHDDRLHSYSVTREENRDIALSRVARLPSGYYSSFFSMSSLTEKFALAFKKEPERSFRKAGITNGDDILSDDGVKVFLTWLLQVHKDQFKKEVVDGILEEMKEEKK